MDLLALLVEVVAKATLVLAFAALGVTALRRSTAAARHWIWTVAAAAVLALPALAVLLPAWPVPFFPEKAPWSYYLGKVGPSDLYDLAPWPVASETPFDAGRDPSPWSRAIVVLWTAGAMVAGARFAANQTRARRLLRGSAPIPPGRIATMTSKLVRRSGLAGGVTVRRSETVGTPMTLGTRHPIVLLPAEADEWSDERLRVVLLHELAHVRRRDCLAQLAAELICVLYWFHPLAWQTSRRLRVERERACDDCVLRAGIRPSDYAGHLLALAWSDRAPVMAMAQRTNLEERLEAILDPRVRHHAPSRASIAGIVLLIFSIVVPLAALDPRASDLSDPARDLFTTHR